ncbi:MAG: TRAP transporter substrate-binding protein DctP [Syntrophaceae bacterium]|nr:TRAP transporter substrate-binding protein DctP [Syntrophaceae bacterium]
MERKKQGILSRNINGGHRLGFTLLICLLAVSVFFLTAPNTYAKSKVKVLKVSSTIPEHGKSSQVMKWWGSELEKRTNGRVKCEYYFAQSLVKNQDSIDALKMGIADIQVVINAYFPTQMPLWGALDLIYLNNSYWVLMKCSEEMAENDPLFKKMYDNVNANPLMQLPAPENIILSTKPIKTLEDLKGLKIRCLGQMNEAMKLLGATPVALPIPEVYEALERGTIDAITGICIDTLPVYRFHEVAKYLIYPSMGTYCSANYSINRDSWNDLPDDIKQIIEDMKPDLEEKYVEIYNGFIKKSNETAVQSGCDVYVLPPAEVARWKAMVLPQMHDKWINKMEKQGMPGRKTVNKYKELIKKYEPNDRHVNELTQG